MLEELKSQLKQVNALRERVETRLKPRLDRAGDELRKMLKQMGADVEQSHSLAEIVAQVRAKNPSFRQLMINLDAATYDTRMQVSWNAHMLSAFAFNKAEQTYAEDLKPLLNSYWSAAESRWTALADKASPRLKASGNGKDPGETAH